MNKIIQSTTNYSRFEISDFNRDVTKISNLEVSMRRQGWIDAYPMHVMKNGSGTLKIKAGHHRFVVAKKLGIPVKFVVCDDTATIHELEKATNPWTPKDYLESFIRIGNVNYVAIKEYMEATGIPLGVSISLLSGESANSSNKVNAFKDGRYKLGDMVHANDVKDVVLHARECGIKFASNNAFVRAISKVLRVDELSIDRLKQKISVHRAKLENKATLSEHVSELEKIYNIGSATGNRLPLAFMADQEAKNRQPKGFKR